jgi:hypothetical protein
MKKKLTLLHIILHIDKSEKDKFGFFFKDTKNKFEFIIEYLGMRKNTNLTINQDIQ